MNFISEEGMQREVIKSALIAISKLHIIEYLVPSQESRAKFIKEQIMHMIEGLNVTYQCDLSGIELEILEEG